MKTFDERLNYIRTKVLKISVSSLATQLEVAPAGITKYEKGEVKPGLDFLEKFCKKYEVSPSWLILGIGEMSPNPNIENPPRGSQSFEISNAIPDQLLYRLENLEESMIDLKRKVRNSVKR